MLTSQLGNQVHGNQIANLTQNGELTGGWIDPFFLFHPCRVAGLKTSVQPFFIPLWDDCDFDLNVDLLTKRAIFEFDLQGFVIYRNFLSEETVRSLNEVIDASPGMRDSIPKFLFATEHPLFLDLLSNRDVLKLCDAWIHPEFRFDNAWGIHYPTNYSGKSHENLHAGPYQNQGYFQYHWVNGRPFCSCLVVAYILADQRKGDGGLAFVPGSHKSNALQAGSQVRELLQKKCDAPWIVQPELFAGDMVVFTEATMHGTLQWQVRERFRRNLYYKYSLGSTSFYPPMIRKRCS